MALSKERERKQYLQMFLKQYTSEFPCIVESRKGKHFAFCAVCGCDISVSHGGKTDVVAHVTSKKHNIIPIFEKVNLSLQAQAPQIHKLWSLLLELLRDIFSRFVNPSWLKRSPELLNLDYHNREAQKGDEDLIIGQETRTVVNELKPSEQQEFFEAVRHYFVTVCDYMRHKFPLTDPALLNAEVVQLKTLDTMFFRKVRFFVDSFPVMLPLQPGEAKMEAVDALQVEFSKLQAQDLPPHILLEEQVDAQWRMVSQLRTADGRLKFSRIAEVMLGILSIPHSNAECERLFSLVRKTRTEFWSSMSDKTLGHVLLAKCDQAGHCYNQTYTEVFLRRAKSATTTFVRK
ncbi:hypothetical protein MRX96_056968 [Rhipicephalus microplus]